MGGGRTMLVHSARMAGWLIYHGHKLIKITSNTFRPNYNVYIFIDSEQLRSDMAEYVPYRRAEAH